MSIRVAMLAVVLATGLLLGGVAGPVGSASACLEDCGPSVEECTREARIGPVVVLVPDPDQRCLTEPK